MNKFDRIRRKIESNKKKLVFRSTTLHQTIVQQLFTNKTDNSYSSKNNVSVFPLISLRNSSTDSQKDKETSIGNTYASNKIED
jgi:hypothetical protein